MDKYTVKKRRNQVFQKYIEKLVSENQMELIQNCSTYLSFVTDRSLEKKKLYRTNMCKNRFCPVCAWKKARKDALELSLLMQDIKLSEEKDFIFLTLTTPNVLAGELEKEIQHYNDSFKRLSNRKRFKTIAKGYVRKLEITYNKKRDDFHPHFHVLIAVNKSYFTDKRYYISQKEWLKLWQDVTGMSEITQVHIQKIKQNNNKELYELAKYNGKDSDYLYNQDVFNTYYHAIKGKQVLVYSGLFREARKKLKNGELDYLKEIDLTEYIYLIFYLWKQNEYLESELYELSEEEKRKINHQMIGELEENR